MTSAQPPTTTTTSRFNLSLGRASRSPHRRALVLTGPVKLTAMTGNTGTFGEATIPAPAGHRFGTPNDLIVEYSVFSWRTGAPATMSLRSTCGARRPGGQRWSDSELTSLEYPGPQDSSPLRSPSPHGKTARTEPMRRTSMGQPVASQFRERVHHDEVAAPGSQDLCAVPVAAPQPFGPSTVITSHPLQPFKFDLLGLRVDPHLHADTIQVPGSPKRRQGVCQEAATRHLRELGAKRLPVGGRSIDPGLTSHSMEIDAGRGIGGVHVGDDRSAVEELSGQPLRPLRVSCRVWNHSSSVVTYTDTNTVELVQAAPNGVDGEQVFYCGVQLTFAVMGEVVAELKAQGSLCMLSDIGYDFEAGFAVFSMSSASVDDIDPTMMTGDERLVVEGVSVAPYDYFIRRH